MYDNEICGITINTENNNIQLKIKTKIKLFFDWVPLTDKSKMFSFEVNLFTIKIDKVNVGLAILSYIVDRNNKFCWC